MADTPFSGTKSTVGPSAPLSLRAIRRPSSAISSRRRAHQRDRRVVDVEVAVLELGRHGVARAEVDHVQRPERDDLRQAGAPHRLQAIGAGGEDAADQVVGELGRGGVERADQEAAGGERLEGLPARPGGVEDEHLVAELLQALARGRDARRGDAEHRRPHQRALAGALAGAEAVAIPAIAPAALVRIREEIWLIPEMSTTEYIIVTSVAPT